MKETIIQTISLTRIRPSKTNPRKHFNEDYISQLSDSIRAKGIIQPLTLRPDWCMGKTDEEIAQVNGNAPSPEFFEIVAGECRYRGAAKADQQDAPSIVRLLSDKETLEIQLIENLQRSDLTPLEEAEGYRRLIEDYGYTVELIHEKTGKTKRTIWGMLKVLKAPKILLDALVKEVVGHRVCEMVARIPILEMRERAAQEILQPKFMQETRQGGLVAIPEQPMSTRVARAHIRDNYMQSLSAAQFDQQDPTYLEIINEGETGERIGGGACTDCPMRSGNRPELLGDLKRPDICTNPKCFAQKNDAHFVRLQENATKEGKKLLSAEESANEFEDSGRLSLLSRYVKLSEQPAAEHVRDGEKRPSWKKLLEGLEAQPQIVVARDPKGRVVELVDFELAREAVNLAAKQKGEKSIFDKSSRTSMKRGDGATSTSGGSGESGRAEEPEWKKQDRKNKEIAKLNFQVTLAAMSELAFRVGKLGAIKGFWDALIEISIEHAGHEGIWLINKRLGLEKPDDSKKQMLEYGRNLKGDEAKAAFVVELLLSQQVKIYNSGSMGGVRQLDRFRVFAKLYKIDLGEIEKGIKASTKLKAKEEPPVAPVDAPPGPYHLTNAVTLPGERKTYGVVQGKYHGDVDNPHQEHGLTKSQAMKRLEQLNSRPEPKSAKQATPKAVIVDPSEQQLEKAFSAPEINQGTIRPPVVIDGKHYTVSGITFPVKGATIYHLVELIPAAEFKGKTRTALQDAEKKGPAGHYYGVTVKYHGESFVLGFQHEHRFAMKQVKKPKAAKPNKSKKAAKKPKKSKKGGVKNG